MCPGVGGGDGRGEEDGLPDGGEDFGRVGGRDGRQGLPPAHRGGREVFPGVQVDRLLVERKPVREEQG